MQPDSNRQARRLLTTTRVRWICGAYVVLLTILLLVPSPWAMLGIARPPAGPSDKPIHLVAFLILTVLVEASQLPWRFVVTLASLIGYALATELAQHALPVRTFEAMDLVQDLLGIALGLAVWHWIRSRRTPNAPP